jgi:hypothetical protein
MPPKKQEEVKEEIKKDVKKSFTPIVEFGDIEIIDSLNYDTNQQTGWEGTVYRTM